MIKNIYFTSISLALLCLNATPNWAQTPSKKTTTHPIKSASQKKPCCGKKQSLKTTNPASHTQHLFESTKLDLKPRSRLFVDGEAMYSWPNVGGFSATSSSTASVVSQMENQGWGGRTALGLIKPLQFEHFALSGEVAWGYYGHVTLNPQYNLVPSSSFVPSQNPVGANMDTYGFDVLAGLFYQHSRYSVFFKAGALLQNIRLHALLDPNFGLDGQPNDRSTRFTNNALVQINTNLPQILPEIRLGGEYQLYNDWFITAAWMHAFGGTLGVNIQDVTVSSTFTSFGNILFNLNNPTMNTVAFGLEYRFN